MVNLRHENSLVQEINNLSANGKIGDSIALTTQTNGSKLTAQGAETKIQKLIPTAGQRLNATMFYLDLMENMEYVPYLGGVSSPAPEQKTLIDFSDSDLHVQMHLLKRETFPLVLFIILNGFFSNLVSLEDCVAKVINIVYDLIPYNKRYSGLQIHQELKNKIPNRTLTAHLRAFRAIGQDRKPDKTGSAFNIAREIRNQLVHDDIAEIVFFPTLSLLGFSPDLHLYFNNSLFPANTPPKHNDTEMITFCKDVYQKTIDFVDECYRLICADLQHSGTLPV